MTVRLTARAFADLQEIAAYIEPKSQQGAVAVINRIRQAIELVGRNPSFGRPVNKRPGVLAMPIGRYPYRIYYRTVGDALVVVHVRHTARRQPKASDLAP